MLDKWMLSRYIAVMLSSSEFHKDFLRLRLSTNEIGVNGLHFSHFISIEALSALLDEPDNDTFSWKGADAVEIVFNVVEENDHSVIVRLKTSVFVSCACVRCLEPINHTLNLDFSLRMLEKEHLSCDLKETEWYFDSTEIDADENDESLVGYFSDKCIDLGIILRDQIFLGLPDYPQCGMGNDSKAAECRKVLPPEDERVCDNPFAKLVAKKN